MRFLFEAMVMFKLLTYTNHLQFIGLLIRQCRSETPLPVAFTGLVDCTEFDDGFHWFRVGLTIDVVEKFCNESTNENLKAMYTETPRPLLAQYILTDEFSCRTPFEMEVLGEVRRLVRLQFLTQGWHGRLVELALHSWQNYNNYMAHLTNFSKSAYPQVCIHSSQCCGS